MSMYYSREGRPISMLDWARAFERGDEARRVAWTDIPTADGGKVSVSTVWLGLDHRFGDGPPVIFETMVFGGPEEIDQDMDRYCTEAEAIAGHAAMVARVCAVLGVQAPGPSATRPASRRRGRQRRGRRA